MQERRLTELTRALRALADATGTAVLAHSRTPLRNEAQPESKPSAKIRSQLEPVLGAGEIWVAS